jgi:hypothetical protein
MKKQIIFFNVLVLMFVLFSTQNKKRQKSGEMLKF